MSDLVIRLHVDSNSGKAFYGPVPLEEGGFLKNGKIDWSPSEDANWCTRCVHYFNMAVLAGALVPVFSVVATIFNVARYIYYRIRILAIELCSRMDGDERAFELVKLRIHAALAAKASTDAAKAMVPFCGLNWAANSQSTEEMYTHELIPEYNKLKLAHPKYEPLELI